MVSEVSSHKSQVTEVELSLLWNSKDLKIHRSVQQPAKSCMLHVELQKLRVQKLQRRIPRLTSSIRCKI